MTKPQALLSVTLGDPFSVNVELLAAAWAATGSAAPARALVVGSRWHWGDQVTRLGLADPVTRYVTSPDEALATTTAADGALVFWDLDPQLPAAAMTPAESLPDALRGSVAVAALEALRSLHPRGPWAVLTMPINKHRAASAGFRWPGQTEFVESLWGEEAIMLLAGPRLKVGLATNHLALRDVPGAMREDVVRSKILRLASTLREVYGVEAPRIGVAAVNPHAGDGGLFGDEDQRVVAPAVARAAAEGRLSVSGPLPADTVFRRAYEGDFDAVLAMYHDQGLGPLKLVHFHDAVNVSGGMRHLRVSPDHGPAEALFLARAANAESTRTALQLAKDYLARLGGRRA